MTREPRETVASHFRDAIALLTANVEGSDEYSNILDEFAAEGDPARGLINALVNLHALSLAALQRLGGPTALDKLAQYARGINTVNDPEGRANLGLPPTDSN